LNWASPTSILLFQQLLDPYSLNIVILVGKMNISDFCCGLLAGWAQVIVGQPFDFVKVKIQTAVCDTPILTIARDIKKEFGLKGFYRGSSSLFFGFAFVIGTEFLVY
jgi:solute carrier family 25 (mitochondrial carnitine/acylcarnitine transporter), member 20/29